MGSFSALFNMSNLALYGVLIMALVTVVTSLLTQEHWRPLTKQIVCLVLAIICSGVYVLIQNDTWHTYVRLALLVFVGSTIFYKLFAPGLRQIESSTTVTKPGA